MNHPTLLLIDVQQGLDEPRYGQRNNPDAEKNMAQLLQSWRERELPVIHVQHLSTNPQSPLHPDAAGCAFKPETAPKPGEVVFTKDVNNAFIGTGLEGHLREHGISSLVIVGLTTDHCVSSTARSAGDLGFRVRLVSDGTATHEREGVNGSKLSADQMHQAHLASLQGEFCAVVTTDEVLASVAQS